MKGLFDWFGKDPRDSQIKGFADNHIQIRIIWSADWAAIAWSYADGLITMVAPLSTPVQIPQESWISKGWMDKNPVSMVLTTISGANVYPCYKGTASINHLPIPVDRWREFPVILKDGDKWSLRPDTATETVAIVEFFF